MNYCATCIPVAYAWGRYGTGRKYSDFRFCVPPLHVIEKNCKTSVSRFKSATEYSLASANALGVTLIALPSIVVGVFRFSLPPVGGANGRFQGREAGDRA